MRISDWSSDVCSSDLTSTLDVLAEAGLLIEDVPTRVERYFNAKFIESGALPDTMRNHLQLWLQIMLGGSRQAPRQLPREPETVEIHIQGLAPVVQGWVEAGRQDRKSTRLNSSP